MDCPRKRCKGRLRVVRTYSGTGFATQERACDSCTFTGTFIVQQAREEITPRALMLRMREKMRRQK